LGGLVRKKEKRYIFSSQTFLCLTLDVSLRALGSRRKKKKKSGLNPPNRALLSVYVFFP
jgi:hypothetical protein